MSTNEIEVRQNEHVRIGDVWTGRHNSNAGRELMVVRVFEAWRQIYVTCSQTTRHRRTTFKLHKLMAAFTLKHRLGDPVMMDRFKLAAWLRVDGTFADEDPRSMIRAGAALVLADAIERGEHAK